MSANRGRFVAYLREKFKTVDAVNRCWGSSYATLEEIGEFRDRTDQPGLYVEWSKFMEREFLNLCREGMEIIRSIDPEARFCIQPPGADNYRTLPKNHVNLFEINQFCATVSTSTGGGISFGRGLLRKSDALIDTPMPEPAFRRICSSAASSAPSPTANRCMTAKPIPNRITLRFTARCLVQLVRGGQCRLSLPLVQAGMGPALDAARARRREAGGSPN